jgi:hypothetical protein
VPERISYNGVATRPLDLSGLPTILDDFRAEVGAMGSGGFF